MCASGVRVRVQDVLRHPSVAPLFPAPVPTTNSSEEPKAYYTQLQETAGAPGGASTRISVLPLGCVCFPARQRVGLTASADKRWTGFAGAGCAADPFLSLIAGVALLSCASQANLTGCAPKHELHYRQT